VPASLHPLHVTPKPCRLHQRHPDQHSRSLLAQFGLTPKSRRGLVVREVGESGLELITVAAIKVLEHGDAIASSGSVFNRSLQRVVVRPEFRQIHRLKDILDRL
jgi:hypothetical protein